MIGNVVTYAVFANAHSIVQLAHNPLQLMLQAQATRPLLWSCHGQGKDPSLEDRPHGITRPAGLNRCDLGIELLRGRRRDRARRGVGKHSVPLCEFARDAAEDRRRHQIFVATGLAANETVQQTILEASKERRGQATAGKEVVRCRFTCGVPGSQLACDAADQVDCLQERRETIEAIVLGHGESQENGVEGSSITYVRDQSKSRFHFHMRASGPRHCQFAHQSGRACD